MSRYSLMVVGEWILRRSKQEEAVARSMKAEYLPGDVAVVQSRPGRVLRG